MAVADVLSPQDIDSLYDNLFTVRNNPETQKLQGAVDQYNLQNPEHPITVDDIPDRNGFWGGVEELGYGLFNALRDQFPEDIARIWQGDDVKVNDDSWAQRLIDEQEKDKASRVPSKQIILGDKLHQALYEGPAGVVTSAATGVAGMSAGALSGSVLPGPGNVIGGMVGAGGTSGVAFYRLAKNQFLHEMLDTAKENDVEITESQWEKLKKDIDDEATEIGLWEAGPEAISQFFTAGLVKGVVGKLAAKIPGLSKVTDAVSKRAMARIPATLAAEIGEEEATEYATYLGQEGIRKDVGLRKTDPSLKEFAETQAGPVAVGAGLQLGAHKIGHKLLSPSNIKKEKTATEEPKASVEIENIKAGNPVDLLEDSEVKTEPEQSSAATTSENEDGRNRKPVDVRPPLDKMREFYQRQELESGPGFGLQGIIDAQFEPPFDAENLKGDIQERYKFKPEPALEAKINHEMAMRNGWRPADFEDASLLSPAGQPQVLSPFEPIDLLLQEKPMIVPEFKGGLSGSSDQYRENMFREASGMYDVAAPEVVSHPDFDKKAAEAAEFNRNWDHNLEQDWLKAVGELKSEGKGSDPLIREPEVESSKQPEIEFPSYGMTGGLESVNTDLLKDSAVEPLQQHDVITARRQNEFLEEVLSERGKGSEAILEHTDGQDKVRYEFRELDDIIPSHDALKNFIKNPSYPQEAQERPYHSDPGEQQKVKGHASPLKPQHFVNDNPTAASGPPIVTSDGITLGGNSRIMSLALAYDQHSDQAQRYKNVLRRKAKQFGLKSEDLKGMKKPVLVRVLQDEVKDMPRASRIYNQDFTQGLDPKAEAVSRGRMLSDESLAHLGAEMENHEALRHFLDSSKSADFMNALKRDGVLEETQLAKFTNKETGLLNSAGKNFVESVLRGVVVDNYDVLDMAPPSALVKLDKALPALIQANNRGPDWSLNTPVQNALRIAGKARSESISVKQFLNQGQLVETVPGLDDKRTRILAEAFGAKGDEGTKAFRFKRQCEEYAKLASMSYGDQGLLPGVSVPDSVESFDKAFIGDINKGKEKENNVSSTAGNLESNSRDSEASDQVGQGAVSSQSGNGRSGDSGNGERVGQTGVLQQSDNLLHSGSSSGDGERSDNSFSGTERQDGSAQRTSGSSGPGRSSRTDDSGESVDTATAGRTSGSASSLSGEYSGDLGRGLRKASSGGHLSLEEKVRQQKVADSSIKVSPGNLQNIRETLPVLFPEQQDDVYKVEQRFANTKDDTSRGMLFTNGTGTGKTYTGLGVIKRFERQGKSNIAIVVPTDKKARDWIEDGRNLHLNITQLRGINDGGRGVVVTTYANFGQNEALSKRDFDLLVFDESHKLCENAQGEETHAWKMMNRLAGPFTPQQSAKMAFSDEILKAAKKHKDFELNAETEKAPWTINEKYIPKALMQRIEDKAKRLLETKVVFLSASPFAYDKTVRYADGFLFDSDHGMKEDGFRSYNTGSNWDQFMMSKFGYRMRYNKLTVPESGVESALMERQFNEWLKKKGALSGRSLQLNKDYSRQFVDVPAQLGEKIQNGIESMSDRDKYPDLAGVVHKAFDYHYTTSLLEALKARSAVDRVQEHLDLGRKVVVFHSRNKGMPGHPFSPARFDKACGYDKKAMAQFKQWAADNPAYAQMDIRGLQNVRDEMGAAFGDKVVFFSGKESKKERVKAVNEFNDDSSGVDVIVVQKDAGKEGISLHDRIGEKQRALVSLYLPTKPTDAIQTEGRIYRLGLMSDAVIEYLKTGLSFESRAFGQKISERAGAAENLAMGELARDLRTAFREGYLDSTSRAPSLEQGRGGKDADSFVEQASPFDQAKTHYYSQQKRTSRNKAREGSDYFATPEPLGFKMVEWLDLKPGESVLEPSAGHGAIARYFPESADITTVESSDELFSKMSVICDGRKINDRFENLALVNKYDGIAMNPPFGSGGKTAVDHLAKAFNHLREGGRVVCILPEGPAADRKFNKWYESEDAEHAHKVAEFGLPAATFGRAGTKVKTRIVVIDKLGKEAEGVRARGRVDFSADTVEELFERIESVTTPERMNKKAGPEISLKEAGLELKQVSNSKGDFWIVTGETYRNKQALKKAGARWNRAEKGWAFYQEETPLQDIAEQLDRLPASLGDNVLEPVDRRTYDEKSKRTTEQTRLFEEQLRKEYGLDFPDGSVFEVKPGRIGRADGNVSDIIHQEGGRESDYSQKRQASREGVKTLDRIAGLFGKKIVYIASDLPILPAEAHADLKQNIVFMRPDANAPHLFLLGHEIVHLMKSEAPALYNKFYALTDSQINEGTWEKHHKLRNRLEQEAGRENGLSREHADEEFIADFSGEQFLEPSFWAEMAVEEPGLFKKFGKKVKQLLDRVLSIFKQKGTTGRYIQDIELVRKGLVSTLAEYSRQQNVNSSSRHDLEKSNRHDGIHFSRKQKSRGHISTESVRSAVQALQSKAGNALPLEVVAGFNDLPGHIRKAFKAQGNGYCEACNDPETGKVWMVAENISSAKRAVELWLHEQGAHHGLRGLMGDKAYAALLGKVHRSTVRDQAYKEIIENYGLDVSSQADRDVAAHEYLARIAEKMRLDEVLSSREKTVWRMVVDAFLNWFAKIRVQMPGSLSRSEINRIVSDAVFWTVKDIDSGPVSGGRAVAAPSFSRGGTVLDSAMSKIGAKENNVRLMEKFKNVRETMRTEFNQGLFDRFAALKTLDNSAEIKDIQESAYVAARMTTSHASQMKAVIEHGAPVWREGAPDVEGKGVAEIFKPVAEELDRYTAWLVGLRAKKLLAEGREKLFTEAEIDELCGLSKGREKLYEDVRQDYIQFKKKVLDFAETAGVVSGSGRQVWEHDEYIPFYRINDEGTVKAPSDKKGIASQYSGIRRLQGGKSNLGDPFENILRNFSHLIDASVKNMAMEKAMTNAEKMGVAVPAEFKWQGVKLRGGALRSALVKVLGDDKAVDGLTKTQRDSLQTVFQMVRPDAKDVIHVLRDGKPVYYHVGDPLLLRALTAVNMRGWNNMGIRAARFFKRILTTGVTSTPDFMLRNIVRDTIHTWGVDRTHTFKPVVGSFIGAVKTMRKDPETIKMMAAGASFNGGYSFGHDPDATRLMISGMLKERGIKESSVLDTPKKMAGFLKKGWNKWEEFGSAFENAPRTKIYQGVIEKGGSHLEASYEAKDIMDYSMGGDWPAIRLLCETVPFFGARLTGLHRLGRAAYENPKAFVMKGALVALASTALYLSNRDKDEFKELEDWDRDNYYHFFTGGEHFRLPKPFEIGAIFGTLPERLAEFALDGQDGELLADRLGFMLTQTFNVDTPQIVTPLLEQWADKSFFTGRSIVPKRLQRLRPEAQKDYNTSATAALIGEKTGTSPKRIEHLVNGYFGTLGVYVLSMADILTRRMTDAPELPEMRLDEMPLIKSFYRNAPEKHSRYLTELYDMIHEADELYLTVKAYAANGDKAKAQELLQDKENRKLLGKRRRLNTVRRKINRIQKAIREVHNSRTMTPARKREQIDKLIMIRNRVVRRVMGE
ncbi:LPD38 domain-containing protein [Maridesulfovibrio bastinii]|uniref:LPD38 domain-containing protein n=1 Tax=Maridesulfovibrio bastinii TaxID=47157 RepID=UPI00041761D4|nr:LPD38 domain-containing protein [Maridesulfovibrio bastinii]